MHPSPARGVIELVLDERHELGVSALSAVFGVQRDDEIKDEVEPLLDLHLCPGAGLGTVGTGGPPENCTVSPSWPRSCAISQ